MPIFKDLKRMKFFLTASFFMLFTYTSFAQKMYIWCPDKVIAPPRPNQLVDVDLSIMINDYRILSEKSINKCSGEELLKALFEIIESSYPSSKITRVLTGKKVIESGKVFIEIDISSYSATFNAPMWFAETSYEVKISDSRSGNKMDFNQSIHKEKRFYNVGGFSTAKNNLNKSYIEASSELLKLISDKLN